jgi:hypothetical protein
MKRTEAERKELFNISSRGIDNLRIQREKQLAKIKKEREEAERRIAQIRAEIEEKERYRVAKVEELRQKIGEARESPQMSRPLPSMTKSIPEELRRLPYVNPDVPTVSLGTVGNLRRTINATRASTRNEPLRQEEKVAPLTPAEQALQFDNEVWHRGKMLEGIAEYGNQDSTRFDDIDDELLTLSALKTQITRTSPLEKIQRIYKKITEEDLPEGINNYEKIQNRIALLKRSLPRQIKPSTNYMGYYKGDGRFSNRRYF